MRNIFILVDCENFDFIKNSVYQAENSSPFKPEGLSFGKSTFKYARFPLALNSPQFSEN